MQYHLSKANFAAIIAPSLLLMRVGSRRILYVFEKGPSIHRNMPKSIYHFSSVNRWVLEHTRKGKSLILAVIALWEYSFCLFLPYHILRWITAQRCTLSKLVKFSFNVFIQKNVCEPDNRNTVNWLTAVAANSRV